MNTTQLLDCCDRRHDRPSQIFARLVKLKLLSPCFTFSSSENRTFYNYDGSLTTPPLLESVIWTVFKEHITMSEELYQTYVYFTEHQFRVKIGLKD